MPDIVLRAAGKAPPPPLHPPCFLRQGEMETPVDELYYPPHSSVSVFIGQPSPHRPMLIMRVAPKRLPACSNAHKQKAYRLRKAAAPKK